MKKLISLSLVLVFVLPLLFACTDGGAEQVNIPQRFFVTEGKHLYARLYDLCLGENSEQAKAEKIKELLLDLKGYEYTGASVGGAEYSGKIYTAGDYTATDDNSFKEALAKAKSGEVIFVPSGSVIDLSDLSEAEGFAAKLGEGVILASDRGINEGGVILFSHTSGTLLTCEKNSTVTGINLRGVVSLSGNDDKYKSDSGIRVGGENVTVSNCEIALFTKNGISVFPKSSAVVDSCFIHHNKNGVSVNKGEVTLTNSAFLSNDTDYKTDGEAAFPETNVIIQPRAVLAEVDEQADITSAVFPADAYGVYEYLSKWQEDSNALLDALAYYSGTDKYYYYKDIIGISKDGTDYGVRDNGTPLGGGRGYEKIYTSGDFTVTDTASLVTALKEAKAGDVVFVDGNAEISVTGLTLTVPEGVILASNRGYENSTGGMLYTYARQEKCIVLSEGAVLTGITLLGADTERHMNHLERGYDGNGYTDYYYSLMLTRDVNIIGSGVEVSNCEISGFSEAGVSIDNSKSIKVHHNYIHHNQRNGYGYGVVLYGQSEAEIYYNMFNFDRHAIAADGSEGSGYSAHDNLHMGTAIYHIFDAHGGADRGDGTNIACDKVEMHNNTFMSDKIPYKKRGTPKEYSSFKYNVILYPESFYSVRQMQGNNFIYEDNIFNAGNISVPEYNFEGGKTYTLDISTCKKYEGVEYIDSATQRLRYAYILVFTPNGNGYYISEYGNNLDDGSINDLNEKVFIPEGGFVLVFDSENSTALQVYKAIEDRHGVIYNTTLALTGDYKASLEGNTLTVTKSN